MVVGREKGERKGRRHNHTNPSAQREAQRDPLTWRKQDACREDLKKGI